MRKRIPKNLKFNAGWLLLIKTMADIRPSFAKYTKLQVNSYVETQPTGKRNIIKSIFCQDKTWFYILLPVYDVIDWMK